MSILSTVESLFFVFLMMGLTIGFGHCVGMCGPIAVTVSMAQNEKKRFLPHLFYAFGRITTYTLLGGIMGFIGSFTKMAIPIVMIQKGVLVLTGLMIVLMGLAMMGLFPKTGIFYQNFIPTDMITKGLNKLRDIKTTFAFFPVGMLLGLLPCGSIYAALVASARSGMETHTALSGTLIGMGGMFFFGLGTAPALLLVGMLSNMGLMKWRMVMYKIGAALMVFGGLMFIYKGIR